jgi:general secretion pathway protein K
MSRPAKPRDGERGYALLIVLWVLVLQSFLMVQIMASSHTALALADNDILAAQAGAAADGAIEAAAFHLGAGGRMAWRPNGEPHDLVVGDFDVTVTIRSLAGRINPNLASAGLLAGLLQAVAVPPGLAENLAQSIVAWRRPAASPGATAALLSEYRAAGLTEGPAGKPFVDLNALNHVIGMTPAIMARLIPHLSLFQPRDPDPALADPIVRAAITSAGLSSTAIGYQGAPVADVTACVQGRSSLCRHAVISLQGGTAEPLRFLALDAAH